MGLRFRKSINLGGGFRINFSKSGIGYSFGGKGFRYTKTARGTTRATASIPGTGISWVEESGKKKRTAANRKSAGIPTDSTYLYSVENDVEIASSDFETFLSAIKHFVIVDKVLAFAPLIAFIGFIVGTVQAATTEKPAAVALLTLSLLAFVGLIIARVVYRFVGRVTATYDLDSVEGQYRVENLKGIFGCLRDCSALWQVNDVFQNATTRRNAGTGQSVARTKFKVQRKKPYFLRTNATTYFVQLKKEKLYILPDVIIVVGKKGVEAAALKDLDISISSVKFVDNVAPKDATVLGYKWQFVNNNGTPDKRFKNNRQLPQCLYGVIDLKTAGGFHVRIQLSNIQKAEEFSNIATEMIRHAENLKGETATERTQDST